MSPSQREKYPLLMRRELLHLLILNCLQLKMILRRSDIFGGAYPDSNQLPKGLGVMVWLKQILGETDLCWVTK